MQFSCSKILYKSIGDNKLFVITYYGENSKGEKKMTRVNKLSADDKARYEFLVKEYQEKIGMSEKKAKKAASTEIQRELTKRRVENTDVYMDKKEYEAAKQKAQQEYEKTYAAMYAENRENGMGRLKAKKAARHQAEEQTVDVNYIKNKKVRNFIEENKDEFYVDGKFNEEKYHTTVRGWTGKEDYKLDLSESRAAAERYDVKARTVRKSAKYGNYEVQKDKTWAYRILYLLGAASVGASASALGTDLFKRNINVTGTNTETVNVIDPNGNLLSSTTHVDEDTATRQIKPSAGKAAWLGAIAGFVLAIPGAFAINDKGEKDIFNGMSTEKIISDPAAAGVEGKENQLLVKAILSELKDRPQEEIVEFFRTHYGENTGKRVTQRELLSMYHELTDKKPEVKQEVQPNVSPKKQPAPVNPKKEPELPKPEPCFHVVQNGETLSKLSKKFGVSIDELIALNQDKIKKFKHATNCDDNRVILGFLAGETIKLPDGACEKDSKEQTPEQVKKDYADMAKGNVDKYCPDRLGSITTYKPENKQVPAKELPSDSILRPEGKKYNDEYDNLYKGHLNEKFSFGKYTNAA